MFYHWITLSSIIILMLFIRRNLRLKILQMLQNGLIILTIWSLMSFKVIETDIPHGILFGNYMVVIQTLFTNLTPLCHICCMICSLTVTYDWFPVVLFKSWRVPHVGQEILTLSGTPDFTPFGEFMILLIRYTYTLCITEFVSLRTMFTDEWLYFVCLD